MKQQESITKESLKFCKGITDRVFKAVFFDKKDNYSLLSEFLSWYLKKKVKVTVVYNGELPVRNVLERVKVADAIIGVGNSYFHLEVNRTMNREIRLRNFSYFASFYSQYISRGEHYDNGEFFYHLDLSKQLRKSIKDERSLLNWSDNEPYHESLKFSEFNLDRIMDYWYKKDEKNIKKHLPIILLCLDREELDSIKERDEYTMKYIKKVKEVNDADWFKPYKDAEAEEEFERRVYLEEGKKSGIEIGKKSGIEIGKEAGIKSGITSVAKNMVKAGFKDQEIMSVTNLGINEIKKLRSF